MRGYPQPSALAEQSMARLAKVEHDVWSRGGVDGQRRRCEAISTALGAGCSLEAIADLLAVSAGDIAAWIPRNHTLPA